MAYMTAPTLSQKVPGRLRKGTALKDGSTIGAAALVNQEDHVVAALGLRLDTAEVVFVVDGGLVDLQDHIPTANPRVLGEGAGLHVLHDDPLTSRNLQALSDLGRHIPYRQAKLAFRRLTGGGLIFLVAVIAGEKLSAVCDGH